jgi:hypothetical protein
MRSHVHLDAEQRRRVRRQKWGRAMLETTTLSPLQEIHFDSLDRYLRTNYDRHWGGLDTDTPIRAPQRKRSEEIRLHDKKV